MMVPTIEVDMVAHELALVYAREQLKKSTTVSDNDRIDLLNNAYNAAYQRIKAIRNGETV